MPGTDLHAPALCDLEVAAAVRRLVRARRLTIARAEEALELYLLLPLRRHDHLRLLPRVWELRDVCSPYDAAYVALAEQLRVPLLTGDAALRRAVSHRLPHLALA